LFFNAVDSNLTVESLLAELAAKNSELAAKNAELAAERDAKIALQDENSALRVTNSSSSSSSSTAIDKSLALSHSSDESDQSTKAFTSEFINDNRVPERLFDHLNRASFPENVNYVALVQGSGHGKTRSIIETCRQYQLVSVYVCFRAANSSGFPLRGKYVSEMLQRMHAGEPMIGNLLSCILAAVEHRLLTFDENKTPFDFRPFGLDENFGIDDSFWNEVLKCQHCSVHGSFSTDRLNLMLSRINSKYARESLKFVFIWDEARALIYSPGSANVASESVSPFRQLRRVITKDQHNHTVSVFLDTFSMVANFLPVRTDDPSSRDFERNFLPPFIHVGQSPEALMENISSSSSDASSMQLTRESQLSLRGRALWNSYHRAGKSLDSLVRIARSKFNATSLICNINDAKSMAAACAIAAAVAQLDIAPLSSLASDMVHSHLGTLIAVKEDRSAILVGFPSEPIVARAALSFLNFTTTEFRLQCHRVLEEVARALSYGLTMTTAGATGEFVSRLYLLLHRDIPHGDMSVVVPKELVSHFLNSLIGSNSIHSRFLLSSFFIVLFLIDSDLLSKLIVFRRCQVDGSHGLERWFHWCNNFIYALHDTDGHSQSICRASQRVLSRWLGADLPAESKGRRLDHSCSAADGSTHSDLLSSQELCQATRDIVGRAGDSQDSPVAVSCCHSSPIESCTHHDPVSPGGCD
jgi:hypothetical protein